MIRYTSRKHIGRLHVITIEDDGSRPYRSPAELALQAIRGGADTIQYRSKGSNLARMLDEALAVRSVCREHGVTFIVNDRVDLCLAVDADGVHLGRDDMPIPIARRILGSERIIGGTVRNVDDLERAEAASADYVGCGPVYATETKELPIGPLGIPGLHAVADAASIPVIGIAGIGEGNVAEVLEAGAYGVAVVSAVGRAYDPEAAARTLRDRIDAALW